MPGQESEEVMVTMKNGNGHAARRRPALECRVGLDAGASVLLPAELVGQIVELTVGRLPPLTAPWVSGAAVDEGVIVVTIRLDSGGPAPLRKTTAVRLRTSGFAICWALEIAGVVGFTEAEMLASPFAAGRLPTWLGHARTAERRELPWLDLPALFASEAGSAVGAPEDA
jgi:hypothetical protein